MVMPAQLGGGSIIDDVNKADCVLCAATDSSAYDRPSLHWNEFIAMIPGSKITAKRE
jgi:hypothetical protein